MRYDDDALYSDELDEDVRGLGRKPPLKVPTRAENRKALAAYFKERRDRLDVVATTRTPAGQTLDWVPITSQPGARRRVADPPSDDQPIEPMKGRQRLHPVTFELEDPEVKRGPEGTVPIVRRNLSLLRGSHTLDEHLSKHGHKTYPMYIDDRDSVEVPADSSAHEYGYSSQWVRCYGAEGGLAAFDPYVYRSDEFSLLQVALARGSGNGKQTIEGGWQEYRDHYGDWVPHLFVFYTTNGYTQSGDNKGGYNRDVDGWVQYSNVVYPEAISSPNSTRGGAQYVMYVKYQLYQGNWWLRCNGRWIGYYPASLFNSSGLRNEAEKVAFYGEIVDSGKDSVSSWTDMGSGYWPGYHWTWSAYMMALRFQSSAAGAMSRYSGSTWESNPTEYGIEEHFANTGSWGSYAWVGGPGGG
jgi:Neprosin